MSKIIIYTKHPTEEEKLKHFLAVFNTPSKRIHLLTERVALFKQLYKSAVRKNDVKSNRHYKSIK